MFCEVGCKQLKNAEVKPSLIRVEPLSIYLCFPLKRHNSEEATAWRIKGRTL